SQASFVPSTTSYIDLASSIKDLIPRPLAAMAVAITGGRALALAALLCAMAAIAAAQSASNVRARLRDCVQEDCVQED
ncbi:unnamed protein product, partial [Urochloa humidicola]